MQILHPFAGSVQQYTEQLADPDGCRPGHCPQCHCKRPLTAHGFYTRTIIDGTFDGIVRVRRYLCQACQRTVSLLPEFVLPYQRGQFWIRRFRAQAEALCATLAALSPPAPAPDFVHRALDMLESTGWIAVHRFLFGGVRGHLLGWPRGLAPDGRRAALSSAGAPA